MTTYAFPPVRRPKRFRWGALPNSLGVPSPVTQVEQTISRPGTRIRVTMGWDAMTPADAAAIEAFLWQLRGGANRTLLWPMHRREPRGTLRGAPTVSAGNLVGTTLPLSNCTPGGTLEVGDYLARGGQVHIVTARAVAAGNATMSLTVEPPIRGATVAGQAVTLVEPKALFRLESNSWELDYGAPSAPGGANALDLSFVEMFS